MGSTSTAWILGNNDALPGPDDGSILWRATRVMQVFVQANSPTLSLAELTELTGIPKPSLHRLLKQMVARRLLERTESGRYQYGMAMFELGRMVRTPVRLREIALPFMQDLYIATHETVHLGLPSGVEVVYVERITGHRTVPVPTQVGGRMPMYCTGLGKAILAYSPQETIDAAIASDLKPLSPHTIRHAHRIRAELNQILIDGVAFDREESVQGIVCIAAPILCEGKPIAAISVTGAKHRFAVERFSHTMRVTADRIGVVYERAISHAI